MSLSLVRERYDARAKAQSIQLRGLSPLWLICRRSNYSATLFSPRPRKPTNADDEPFDGLGILTENEIADGPDLRLVGSIDRLANERLGKDRICGPERGSDPKKVKKLKRPRTR
jgi:hypothetical protein